MLGKNNEEMSKILDSLEEYFENTPEDVLKKEFDEIYEKWGNVGPTVQEYLTWVRKTTTDPQIKKIIDDSKILKEN